MNATASNSTAGGLRERKKRATRRALQEAAIHLFTQHGPGSVTVEDVCAAADVSPRTFFNYFRAKEEVIIPWAPEAVAATPERIAQRPTGENTLTPVHAVLAGLLDESAQNTTSQARTMLLGEYPALLHRSIVSTHSLEKAVREGIARRTAQPAEDPRIRLTAGAAMTALRVAMESRCQPAEPSPETTLDEAFEQLRHSLRAI